jgi:hypothetical protein
MKTTNIARLFGEQHILRFVARVLKDVSHFREVAPFVQGTGMQGTITYAPYELLAPTPMHPTYVDNLSGALNEDVYARGRAGWQGYPALPFRPHTTTFTGRSTTAFTGRSVSVALEDTRFRHGHTSAPISRAGYVFERYSRTSVYAARGGPVLSCDDLALLDYINGIGTTRPGVVNGFGFQAGNHIGLLAPPAVDSTAFGVEEPPAHTQGYSAAHGARFSTEGHELAVPNPIQPPSYASSSGPYGLPSGSAAESFAPGVSLDGTYSPTIEMVTASFMAAKVDHLQLFSNDAHTSTVTDGIQTSLCVTGAHEPDFLVRSELPSQVQRLCYLRALSTCLAQRPRGQHRPRRATRLCCRRTRGGPGVLLSGIHALEPSRRPRAAPAPG